MQIRIEAPTRLDMLRRFFAERRDPEPYHRGMAERSLRQIPFPLGGEYSIWVADPGITPAPSRTQVPPLWRST
jgi:hypothetical protein